MKCQPFGEPFATFVASLFPFAELSGESMDYLRNLGNRLGSACGVVEGEILKCGRQPHERSCCHITKHSITQQGPSSITDIVEVAGKIGDTTFAGVRLGLDVTIKAAGYGLRSGHCDPDEGKCEDEKVDFFFSLKLSGTYTITVLLPPTGTPVPFSIPIFSRVIQMNRKTTVSCLTR